MSQLKPFFPLTYNFFGLNSSYKAVFWEEIGFCVDNLNFSYDELMKMSVAERRYHIGRKRREHEKIEDAREKGASKSNGRTSTISGEALKSTMINNKLTNKISGL